MTVARLEISGDEGTLTRRQFDRIRLVGEAELEERRQRPVFVRQVETEAPEMTLEQLRERISPNAEFDQTVDGMQRAGWTDESIVRLLLGGHRDTGDGSGRRSSTNEKIVELLRARDGEIRSAAGECVAAIAGVLGLSRHTVRQSLEGLDRNGIVERDVTKHTGTTRVALIEGASS